MLVQAAQASTAQTLPHTLGGITPLGSRPAEAALQSVHMSASPQTPAAASENARSRIEPP